jgi:lipopolysaccharide/colanic/teichoic acid biosynthesis glycosyltransferase
MPKQPAGLADSNSNKITFWQQAGGRVISIVITLLLILLTWFFLDWMTQETGTNDWGYIVLVIMPAALSLALERSLSSSPLPITRRYRIAFFTSVSLFLAFWILSLLLSGSVFSPWSLLLIILGSFLGSILATHFNEGLWENNSPPSQAVTRDVFQQHQALIGQPDPIPFLKRAFDILLSTFGLLLSLPVWFLGVFIIWLEDPGPLLFVKNSVGKGGKNFHQYKLRTMVRGAEDATGPVLASEKDDRVLGMGYLLRKTALDELPQLLNILLGEMSFVGPRPQRTVLVQGYLRDLPAYAQRHSVLPGLAGLAQVAGDYYLTPLQKLRFDRLYIKYTSLGFDLKLILLAFLLTFWYRWQKDWDGRLPRYLLRIGS